MGNSINQVRATRRKGLSLNTTYNAYRGLELAQAGDEAIAVLKGIQATHRQMMEMDYCRKFAVDVEHIGYLREKADTLANKIRDAWPRLQVIRLLVIIL